VLEKLNKIEEGKGRYFKPLIIDIEGKPRGLILRGNISTYNKICFDGSSIKGHAKVEESDLIAKPDPRTIKTINVGGRTMEIVICDVEKTNGEPYQKNPRVKLKEYILKFEKQNWKFKIGVEIEYFIIRRKKNGLETFDKDQYFEVAPYTKSEKIQLKIMEKLNRIGIELEKTHHEVAEGQYEYSIKASNPLTTADNIVIAKMVTKDIVRKYGFEATFMPKPFKNMNGSGMHIHISLLNEEGNIFYDKSKDNISQEALYAIGGILKSSKEISILVAPTVNSYKRLKPNYEAPNKICWGYGNRSALIRVPIAIDEETCRIEYRHPDPSCNPYLAIMAVMVLTVNGIINKIDPGEPCRENAYKISGKYTEVPSNLGEALSIFENSKLTMEILGEELHNEIVKMKRDEWREYLNYILNNKLNDEDITDWEINRYLVKA